MCACKIKETNKYMMRSIMVGREKKWGRCVSDLHPAFLSRHQPSFEKSPDIETDVELTVSADNLSLDTLKISQVQGFKDNLKMSEGSRVSWTVSKCHNSRAGKRDYSRASRVWEKLKQPQTRGAGDTANRLLLTVDWMAPCMMSGSSSAT